MPLQLESLVVDLAQHTREKVFGKYRGSVVDVDDPQKVGRIKVRVPAVLGDEVSPWAEPCAPFTGPGMGLYAVPPVGAAVWVEFEAGQISRPIWSGGYWGSGELPKNEAGSEATPPLKILQSASGLLLALDDDGHTATLSDANGNNLLKISVDSGEVRIQATAKVIVDAPQIELVDGATHPLVFGDDLLQYLNDIVMKFNTHLHVGQTVMGIPVTPMAPAVPFPPATPALLSVHSKTG